MFEFIPSSKNALAENQSDMIDGNFGGNREITDNIQDPDDYTKKDSTNPNAKKNPVDETTDDIDDMTDPEARKREFSRRAETSAVGADNQYRRPGDGDDKTYTEPDHRPTGEGRSDDAVVVPEANTKHGSRNPYRFGEDYDRLVDQNEYESEIR